jgi:microcystin-dependent protein
LPFTPAGWLPCDGRLMSIMRNQQLFSLLGPAYGGNAQIDFALPRLEPAGPQGPGYFIAVTGSCPAR